MAFHLHRERFVIVLQSYLDDSGTNDESLPVVVVGGFVADNTLWDAFEDRWSKFLVKFELERFHACHFLGRHRPYNRWSDEKYERAQSDVCDILSSYQWIGIGTIVTRTAFREWRDGLGHYIDPDPYYFCLDNCLRRLILGIKTVPKDDGVAIYVDQDKGREKLGQRLSEWNERRLRSDPGYRVDPKRPISTTYGSCIIYKPLQAADILAHAFYQLASQILVDENTATPNIFYEALKKNNAPIGCNFLHTRELLEIDAKSLLYRGEKR